MPRLKNRFEEAVMRAEVISVEEMLDAYPILNAHRDFKFSDIPAIFYLLKTNIDGQLTDADKVLVRLFRNNSRLFSVQNKNESFIHKLTRINNLPLFRALVHPTLDVRANIYNLTTHTTAFGYAAKYDLEEKADLLLQTQNLRPSRYGIGGVLRGDLLSDALPGGSKYVLKVLPKMKVLGDRWSPFSSYGSLVSHNAMEQALEKRDIISAAAVFSTLSDTAQTQNRDRLILTCIDNLSPESMTLLENLRIEDLSLSKSNQIARVGAEATAPQLVVQQLLHHSPIISGLLKLSTIFSEAQSRRAASVPLDETLEKVNFDELFIKIVFLTKQDPIERSPLLQFLLGIHLAVNNLDIISRETTNLYLAHIDRLLMRSKTLNTYLHSFSAQPYVYFGNIFPDQCLPKNRDERAAFNFTFKHKFKAETVIPKSVCSLTKVRSVSQDERNRLIEDPLACAYDQLTNGFIQSRTEFPPFSPRHPFALKLSGHEMLHRVVSPFIAAKIDEYFSELAPKITHPVDLANILFLVAKTLVEKPHLSQTPVIPTSLLPLEASTLLKSINEHEQGALSCVCFNNDDEYLPIKSVPLDTWTIRLAFVEQAKRRIVELENMIPIPSADKAYLESIRMYLEKGQKEDLNFVASRYHSIYETPFSETNRAALWTEKNIPEIKKPTSTYNPKVQEPPALANPVVEIYNSEKMEALQTVLEKLSARTKRFQLGGAPVRADMILYGEMQAYAPLLTEAMKIADIQIRDTNENKAALDLNRAATPT